jgi:hypothetical protein
VKSCWPLPNSKIKVFSSISVLGFSFTFAFFVGFEFFLSTSPNARETTLGPKEDIGK